MAAPVTQSEIEAAQPLLLGGTCDPRVVGLDAAYGAIYILGNPANPAAVLQKQSAQGGDAMNWKDITGSGPTPPAPVVSEPPAVWYNLKPKDGKTLPVSAAPFRAYYPVILYSPVASFFDGAKLRKYLAYFGGSNDGTAFAAFSDDGISWDHEQALTGLQGLGYHACAIVVAGTIHYFYWNTNVSIYGPSAVRHATFNPAASCVAATSDQACSGNFITGIAGNLRYGTYGFDQIFYNPAPTNNPANPYSYAWCAIHNGTDGTNEGVLFATSPDGMNFSAWNGLVEVIPRGVAPAWDQWIGRMNAFIDSAGFWHAFYSGGLGTAGGEDSNFAGAIGYATSLNGITWTKYQLNPIIRKTESLKSWKRLYTPWIIKDATGYHLYFSCKSNAGVYAVAIADFAGFV
jgi:hypothetical protein